ncbi:hypothetical protein JTE88_07285 [Arcanobacterium phocisimile]|uniref:N-acetyl-1-D-myo-inositol-2-amino-2-deoxy-alpha-D-glucopyranoside deacetylase n=1 Tax=Arcanobacterium phocisimile TaxID=1302235 RepID=A0ABX7IFH2_9ACTO|nr:hypothetical protein [Arcanobacterium phocisimile]QRV01878.1 hypothetical protein JTE88_07285 [Arcanobacterium phocisimile]
MIRVLAGIVLGALSAVMSLVAYSGPLDQPWIGLALATGIVASGAWLTVRLAGMLGWVCYALVGCVATVWLLYFPPANIALYTDYAWADDVWLLLCSVALWLPVLIDRFFGRTDRAGGSGATVVNETRNEE